jgi:GcrA cell cycle regulator
MAWTQEQKDTAIRLWREGRSAAFIAGELGATITRNAVIGVMHRLGIASPKANPHSPVWGQPPRLVNSSAPRPYPRTRRPSRPRLSLVEPTPIQSKPVALLEVAVDDCRWPLNDARDIDEFRFCGALARSGSSYCAGHHFLAHRPSERRQSARHWEAAWAPGRVRRENVYSPWPIEENSRSRLNAEYSDYTNRRAMAGRANE